MNTTEILNEINDPGTRRSLQIMFDKILTEKGSVGSDNIKIVRDGQSIQSVINLITDASADNLYEVLVPPGHEDETFTAVDHVRVINTGGPQNVRIAHEGQSIQSVIDGIKDASITNPYDVIIPTKRANEAWTNASHITVTTAGHAVEIPAYADDNAAIKDGLAGDRFYHVAGDAKILAKKILIMKDADADQTVNIILSLPTGKSLVIDHGDTNSTNVSGPQTTTTYTVTYGDANAHEVLISGDLNSITYFKIAGEPVSKIYNIHYLSGITYLDLSGNDLTDIGLISDLTALRTLRLFNNTSLADIGAVTKLTDLISLSLYNCNLSDLGSVANLINLTSLYLRINSFSSTELSDYIDQTWTNRAALGALSCAIKIESNDSTPSCDADAVAKIEGTGAYVGDGLKDVGCTITYDA